jgi:hypothetical protein
MCETPVQRASFRRRQWPSPRRPRDCREMLALLAVPEAPDIPTTGLEAPGRPRQESFGPSPAMEQLKVDPSRNKLRQRLRRRLEPIQSRLLVARLALSGERGFSVALPLRPVRSALLLWIIIVSRRPFVLIDLSIILARLTGGWHVQRTVVGYTVCQIQNTVVSSQIVTQPVVAEAPAQSVSARSVATLRPVASGHVLTPPNAISSGVSSAMRACSDRQIHQTCVHSIKGHAKPHSDCANMGRAKGGGLNPQRTSKLEP